MLEPEWLADLKVSVEKRRCVLRSRYVTKNEISKLIFDFDKTIYYFISYLQDIQLLASRISDLFCHPRQLLTSISWS